MNRLMAVIAALMVVGCGPSKEEVAAEVIRQQTMRDAKVLSMEIEQATKDMMERYWKSACKDPKTKRQNPVNCQGVN